ncbi:hypothetical protein [Bradyrhizobium sp. USDA 3364]
MSNFRFGLLAIGVFAFIFIGGTWAKHGFPLLVYGIQPLKRDARLPTFGDGMDEKLRKDWVATKSNQGDGNAERNKLRRELLQASNAYKLSPCSDMAKKNLVEALSNYTNAWHALAWCTSGVNGCPRTLDESLDAAAATFQTPADLNLHQAVRDAVEIGGIYRSDFPESIRHFVFQWGNASPPDEPKEACLVARKTASRK